jgi:hypothetical protein
MTRQKFKHLCASKFQATRVSIYGSVKGKMLLSYVLKKNRAVLLVSSGHHSACVDPDMAKQALLLRAAALSLISIL